MNLLGLVFAILMILSYSFYSILDSQGSQERLKTTYLSHIKANRAIYNSYQSAIYRKCRGRSPEVTKTNKNLEKTTKPKEIPRYNPSCARFNLHLLTNQDSSQVACQTALHILQKLYHPLFVSMQIREKEFLHELIQTLRETKTKELEKLHFSIKKHRQVYYKMLKGTKEWDLLAKKGIPPFLDFFKIESAEEKLCLLHAHPSFLQAIFHKKTAEKLYQAIHEGTQPVCTKKMVERICYETNFQKQEEEFLDLFCFEKKQHHHQKEIFAFEDPKAGVFLRKDLSIK